MPCRLDPVRRRGRGAEPSTRRRHPVAPRRTARPCNSGSPAAGCSPIPSIGWPSCRGTRTSRSGSSATVRCCTTRVASTSRCAGSCPLGTSTSRSTTWRCSRRRRSRTASTGARYEQHRARPRCLRRRAARARRCTSLRRPPLRRRHRSRLVIDRGSTRCRGSGRSRAVASVGASRRLATRAEIDGHLVVDRMSAKDYAASITPYEETGASGPGRCDRSTSPSRTGARRLAVGRGPRHHRSRSGTGGATDGGLLPESRHTPRSRRPSRPAGHS